MTISPRCLRQIKQSVGCCWDVLMLSSSMIQYDVLIVSNVSNVSNVSLVSDVLLVLAALYTLFCGCIKDNVPHNWPLLRPSRHLNEAHFLERREDSSKVGNGGQVIVLWLNRIPLDNLCAVLSSIFY